MASHNSSSGIDQYYLQVQALTPSQNNAHQKTDLSPSYAVYINSALIPLLIFGGVASTALGIVAFKNIQHFSSMNRGIKLVFVLLVIPVAMMLANRQTNLSIRANPATIPREITISQVTSTSFKIAWQTDTDTSGAIRISQSPRMKPIVLTIAEDTDKKTTQHSQVITKLHPETIYFVEILSEALWYDLDGKPLTVTTLLE